MLHKRQTAANPFNKHLGGRTFVLPEYRGPGVVQSLPFHLSSTSRCKKERFRPEKRLLELDNFALSPAAAATFTLRSYRVG